MRKSMKKSDTKTKTNIIVDKSQEIDNLVKPSLNSASNKKYDLFTFEINEEFIEENKKMSNNLVRHRHNQKQKFAPFTKSQRRKRRAEVYKLHFEHGIPATRIAEMMKVDRNTINNDLKILYRQALRDYDPNNMNLDDILQKQLLRMETQRDRLALYICDLKDVSAKIPIERLIADIDFKMIGAIEKMQLNINKFWDEIIKEINRIAEEKKLDIRYTSLFELQKISIDSRKSLNKLRQEILDEKKHV